MSTLRWLVSCVAVSLSLAACAPPRPLKREPLGYLPRPATSAEPLWLPFMVRAGTPVHGDPRERHLAELRQLTFEGDHGRARFSPDGQSLLFESTRRDSPCTQLYVMDLASGRITRVSSGVGRAALGAYVGPSGERVVYALSSSAPAAGESCRASSEATYGDWPREPLQLFSVRADGSDRRALLPSRAQDAQAFVTADGSRLGFTSTRDGNPELYAANLDGTDLVRITRSAGYDGEGAFSTDGAVVVWSSESSFSDLLFPRVSAAERDPATQVWEPPRRELLVAGDRGQDARFVTQNGKRNTSPCFVPRSRRVIFASDMDSPPAGVNLELYVVDTTNPTDPSRGLPESERITYFDGFDGLPSFSPDGHHVVFASSRHATTPGAANLFIARWVE